ncbi:MAG: peptidoglycan editing factor PgeF [Rhizomicrobium sp.]
MLHLKAASLSALPGITHGFFGRTGGVSSGLYDSLNCGPGSGDARANVAENRRRVAAALGDAALVTLGQIHSPDVVTVTRPWPIGETRAEDARHIPLGDAMVSAVPGIALGILTADCAPVLFADAQARVIGAAHAGWKGALGGVLANTLDAMEALGARRTRIAAAIGPCIGQANYEVGAEFQARFVAEDMANATLFVPSQRAGHHHFDLEGFVANRLHAAGVDRIERLSACTYARSADFFSFRRATHRGEGDYGREISAIVLR